MKFVIQFMEIENNLEPIIDPARLLKPGLAKLLTKQEIMTQILVLVYSI